MVNSVNSSQPVGTQGAQSAQGSSSDGFYVTTGKGESKAADSPSTDPKFGEVLNKIQANYGGKKEKPREIKKTLGKDDFLRIMIHQMKNQDPTNPFKPEQMAAEMAQFASVEQLSNVNQNLQKMANQGQPLERMAMSNLIGKTVTVDRDRFVHKEGESEPLSFVLPKDAKEVSVAVVSDAGEVLFEKDLGPQKQGDVSTTWDGTKKNGLLAKTGNYQLKILAKDDRDTAILLGGPQKARVSGIGFEGAETMLVVGDGHSTQKVPFNSVVRIEEDAVGGSTGMMRKSGETSGLSNPIGATASAGSVENSPPAPSLISFKKGEGSSTVSAEAMPPEVKAALQKFQGGGQAVPSQKNAEVKAEGFPNGLQQAD